MRSRSSILAPFRLPMIGDMLLVGFGALVLCMLIAGIIGWNAVQSGARDVSSELESLLITSRETSGYANIIAGQIEATAGYIVNNDTMAQHDFRQLGRQAHQLQRHFNALPHRTPAEIASIAAVDQRLAAFENAYALARLLNDLGRRDVAQTQAQRGRLIVTALLDDLGKFDDAKTTEARNVTNRLERQASWRATLVLGSIVVAVLLALLVALWTIRVIARPLRVLTYHANRLSEGDLSVHTAPDGFPGEFVTLASAMNHASTSLSRMIDIAVRTADDVTRSATDLATAAQEISDTANQVSDAITQISSDANVQVQQSEHVTCSLDTILGSADSVAAGAEEVRALAGSIETQAQSRQSEMERSLGILYDVRTIVLQAVDEVRALNTAVGNINKFVVTVGRIADQTNLLSLNAAIEAARAGAAGRGFGVVADEIRKLADQARAAADDVVELTASVTARVVATSTTMERGAGQVDEIERVSHEINQTLAVILGASERTKAAADSVAQAADANVQAVQEARESLSSMTRTAEGYAATALQVSASSEEQSAACEQMSSASVLLLRGSTQLLEVVRDLKIA